MKVKILLSSYNGEKYIRQQLDSLLAQTQEGLEVIVRDDGSTDNTCKILQEYEKTGRVNWIHGKNLGCVRSFWQLILDSGEADYYGFCDQDDVWDPDKTELAVRALKETDYTGPNLYMSDVRVVDADLQPISEHMSEVMPVDYPHALIKNVCPGCTYVFNRAAMELLREYDPDRYGLDLHDWNVYRIVSCFGKVVFDGTGHMQYRQHANNVIGATARGFKAVVAAYGRFSDGEKTNSRECYAKRMEAAFGDRMSPENREITKLFAHYRENPAFKRSLLFCRKLKFSGIKHLYFRGLILLNKL